MIGDIINLKYAKLLLALQGGSSNLTELCKDVGLPPSTLSVQISRFSLDGLITKKSKGRQAIAELTEFGEEQAKLVRKIIDNEVDRKNNKFNKESEKVEETKKENKKEVKDERQKS